MSITTLGNPPHYENAAGADRFQRKPLVLDVQSRRSSYAGFGFGASAAHGLVELVAALEGNNVL